MDYEYVLASTFFEGQYSNPYMNNPNEIVVQNT